MNLFRRSLSVYLTIVFSVVCFGVAGVFVEPAAGASADVTKALSGKTIRIIVGYSPGGGFDTLTRVVAPHLSRHLPGKPNIIVTNMTGAGGAVALNQRATLPLFFSASPVSQTVLRV